MEDLLKALADLRSFPETRFFVARGIVGEIWSTESAAPAAFPASVLVLLVKEPVGGGRQSWRERNVGTVCIQTETRAAHRALCD